MNEWIGLYWISLNVFCAQQFSWFMLTSCLAWAVCWWSLGLLPTPASRPRRHSRSWWCWCCGSSPGGRHRQTGNTRSVWKHNKSHQRMSIYISIYLYGVRCSSVVMVDGVDVAGRLQEVVTGKRGVPTQSGNTINYFREHGSEMQHRGKSGCQIDPSWGGPIELFLVPASVPWMV